ncbi:MAG: hypothetical protein ACU85U_01170 [Gammaproteobacteria bacterium]
MRRKIKQLRVVTRRAGNSLGATVALCLLFSALDVMAAGTIKCWNNHEGVRECGNVVPPEFIQQGHEIKSAGGVTLGRESEARSIQDVEAEHAARSASAAAAATAREQAAKDRVLLDTFSSEDDMILARDGQIAHLESQAKITESHIDKLKRSLDELIGEAADHERRGKEPPEKLVRDIESLREQIADNEKFIETKRVETREIKEKFQHDIARFRTLKGLDSRETASAQ